MDQTTSDILPWPPGIFAITLFVEDLPAAKQFYQQVFGLPVDYEDDASAVFKFGDMLINLLKTTAAPVLIQPATVAKPGLDPALLSPFTWRMWMRCVRN